MASVTFSRAFVRVGLCLFYPLYFFFNPLIWTIVRILVRESSRKESLLLPEKKLVNFRARCSRNSGILLHTNVLRVDSIAVFCVASRKIRATETRKRRAGFTLLSFVPDYIESCGIPDTLHSHLNDRALFPFHSQPWISMQKKNKNGRRGRGAEGGQRDKYISTTKSPVFADHDDLQLYATRSLQTRRANGMMNRGAKRALEFK